MNKTKGKNIADEVLEELDFSNEEKELFKEIIKIIKKSKTEALIDPSTEIIAKIEGC
ncbi:hypothetical protein M3638_10295 [Oceanobacillus profundus]|uniref:hypothetical protein n=1 Tax=Oceanobacillus profundus TaxID=372463 RepID=UPI00203F38BC|nr:hypothetical protein [Oceanobacillus profundus]MCM3398213.1 hypothetical protein [Oceanobacillus profundus]